MHVAQESEVTVTKGYDVLGSSSNITICNSSFTGTGAVPNAASSADPTTHPAVTVLYGSSLCVSGCNFTGNDISTIKAYASNITAAGDLI